MKRGHYRTQLRAFVLVEWHPWVLPTKSYLNVVRTKLILRSSPREANSQPANQEIPSYLQNTKFHYCVCKILLLDPIPSDINLVHIFIPTQFL
jgi:hypothetical protein